MSPRNPLCGRTSWERGLSQGCAGNDDTTPYENGRRWSVVRRRSSFVVRRSSIFSLGSSGNSGYDREGALSRTTYRRAMATRTIRNAAHLPSVSEGRIVPTRASQAVPGAITRDKTCGRWSQSQVTRCRDSYESRQRVSVSEGSSPVFRDQRA